VQEITAAFSKADIPEVLRLMDKELGSAYSLKSLFSDDRRTILRQIVNSSLEEAEAGYRQIYESHIPLAHFLQDLGVPLPRAIRTAADFAVNSQLRTAFAKEDMDLDQIRKVLDEARAGGIALDNTTLEYTLRLTLERMFERFETVPPDQAVLERLDGIIQMAHSLPFEVVLWTAQNAWSKIHRRVFEEMREGARPETEDGNTWVQHFLSLGERLQMRVRDGVHAHAG